MSEPGSVLPDGVERLSFKDVLVLRDTTWDDSMSQRLAGITGRLVVELHDGATLESLNETQMREHGWVRDRPAVLAAAGHYFATPCLHGLHDQCKGKCKFCAERCRCDCHREESADGPGT